MSWRERQRKTATIPNVCESHQNCDFFFTLFTGQCLVQMGTSQLLYSRILHLTKFLLIPRTYGHICILCRAAGLSGVSVTSNIPHGPTERPELVSEQPGTSRIPAPKLVFKNTHCLPLEVVKTASYYPEYCQRERRNTYSVLPVPTTLPGSEIVNKNSSS